MHQTSNVGELGEQLVAKWLQAQNWVILHHRWRCRWGEIDLIAQQNPSSHGGLESGRGGAGETYTGNPTLSTFTRLPLSASSSSHRVTPSPLLAFVEVKTRSRGNWDVDGLLAITPPKQAKLWQTAELFLAEHPDLANLPCRFDVALVSCQRLSQRSRPDDIDLSPSTAAIGKAIQMPSVQMGQPIVVAGYRLMLQDYIQAAFD